ncbi:M14 family metallopeptidase [uncultured Phascolarctobacterium sp.]|uniref:M14 family metallopeptidase n=1 Tax=uncultured Phascolarctobacterium sp. TaxID=512296 RepID=UPI0025E27098|nr:M14 family metallopeptidase [uncultured Phascolarctobacterium sp.]
MSDTLHICGLESARGQKLRTCLPVLDTTTKIPITIINGCSNGPTVLITAGIHGGEYPGIAAAMELGRDIAPEDISGCLIILHPVNIHGFWARREFIVPEDGKNLNREFPGDANGTLSQKTAWLLSHYFFPLADFYIDMHSGDIHEELHPYVYYPGLPNDDISAKSRDAAQTLDMEFMVRSTATTGAYNYAAISGIPSLLIERGGTGMCLRQDIDAYKNDIHRLLHKLGCIAAAPLLQKGALKCQILCTSVAWNQPADKNCAPACRSWIQLLKYPSPSSMAVVTALPSSSLPVSTAVNTPVSRQLWSWAAT